MEPRQGFTKEFIEGEGYLVKETGANAAPFATPVHQQPVAATAVATTPMTAEALQKIAGDMGQVLVPVEDYQDLLARVGELENQLSHQAQGGKEPEVQESEQATAGKKKKPTQKQVKEAASFDELNSLMEGVDDEKLLTLADGRAEELKAKGAK